jgi:hypothetical protein
MSQLTQRAASYGAPSGGVRRDTPTISSISATLDSRRSSAVPTFPLAPTTTTRTTRWYPLAGPATLRPLADRRTG